MGKAAYSVMEQGKIDQILSSKPDERRFLFMEENIASFEKNIQAASLRIGENDSAVCRNEGKIHSRERERSGRERGLEAITDNIVAILDAGLREAGYSAAELKRLAGRLAAALADAAAYGEKALALFERYRKSAPDFGSRFTLRFL